MSSVSAGGYINPALFHIKSVGDFKIRDVEFVADLEVQESGCRTPEGVVYAKTVVARFWVGIYNDRTVKVESHTYVSLPGIGSRWKPTLLSVADVETYYRDLIAAWEKI